MIFAKGMPMAVLLYFLPQASPMGIPMGPLGVAKKKYATKSLNH